MVIWSEPCARSVGAITRLRPANAIPDAKTNFFMQCSWELQKSKLKLTHPQAESATVLCIGCCAGVPD
jgi:hypothetical protein